MQAPVHHINGLTTIIRERLLPIEGTVLARPNQKVAAADTVAETRWSREHALIDVARALEVSPEAADRLIRCKAGEVLKAGAEIAAGRGLFPKRVTAPRDGRVIVAGGGQVLMETGESKFELKAGLPGTVVEIIPNRGVVVQTTGALVQGAWGNGRLDSGLLVNVAEGPGWVLTAARLDVSLRGSILMAGMVQQAETLKAAAELPVRGLILASLSPSLIQTAREMKYPIMLTDGIGSLPMNAAAYKLLSTNAKRDITLNAEAHDRYSGARPEAIVQLPVFSEAAPPKTFAELEIGRQVRLRRPPAAGQVGTLAALLPGLTVLPSGLRAPAAEIKLENGESVIAPLVNLEVVG